MNRTKQRARLGIALLGMGCALLLFALGSAPIGSAAGASDTIVVNSISPSAGPVGATVALSGKGFGPPSPTSFVTFAGMRAETVSWSDTRVEVVVPARAIAGYAGVTVDGVTSNGVWFAPSSRPHVVALSSSILPIGTNVTIFGSGFGASQRAGWVTFSGVRAPIVSWSDSKIVAVVPVGTRTGYVGVWQSGACSNGVLFIAGENPQIRSLSKTVSFAGDVITVSGADFGAAPDSTKPLTIGGTAIDYDSWSDTSITFTVPSGTKSGYVGVWRNGVSSNGKLLFVAPRIASLSARTVFAGSPVVIKGSGFGPGPEGPKALSLGGTAVTPDAWSDTEIAFTVPAGARSGYVGVTYGGATSNGVMLYVIPHVTGISASWGPPGSSLTITGSGFDASPGRVTFAGAEAAVQSWADDRIVVTVPDAAEGAIGVWVGNACSNAMWFWPVEQPHVTDVTGTIAPGESITVFGTGFGPAASTSSVRLGDTSLDVVSWSDTQIECTLPASVQNGYVGVWKRKLASNGFWVNAKK